MANLEHSHPWVFEQMTTNPGSWTYQKQSANGFNGQAADQAIETTINKESKSVGGIVGISKKRGMSVLLILHVFELYLVLKLFHSWFIFQVHCRDGL